MSKHTPGPWKIYWGRDNDSYPLGIWAMRSDGFCNRSVVTSFGCKAQAESDANARLISAAPELLEALKNCIKQIQALCSEDDVPDGAFEAIAKAEGR